MSSHPRRRKIRSEQPDLSPRLTLGSPRAASPFLPEALEEISEAIFITDRDDRIQYWNAAAERQYGAQGRTLFGLQLSELYRPSWLARDTEPLDLKALEAKGSWQGEAIHFTRHGESIHVRLSVRTLKDGAGTVAGHLWVIQDITERRRAEQALQKSEERFRLLAENAQDVVYRYRLTPQRGFEYVSPSVTSLTGYTPEDHYANPDLLLDLVHSEDRGMLEAYLRDPSAHAGPIVLRWLRKDGGIIWTEQRNVARYDENRRVAAIEGIVRDISDRRQAEERLQALSHRLLAVQENERRLLARELHDELGQELTAAQIQLQSLAAGRSRATSELLAKTSAIIDRTLNRVRNLSLDLRPSMLDDLGLVVALRWQVDRSGQLAEVKTSFVVDDPQRRYPAATETACFRVAQEALTNAVRHSKATTVEVRLHREGAELVLEVRDDGIGFDVHQARQRAAQGDSLGLLSMQERPVLAGASWQVISEPGAGTVVVARFPVLGLEKKNSVEGKGS